MKYIQNRAVRNEAAVDILSSDNLPLDWPGVTSWTSRSIINAILLLSSGSLDRISVRCGVHGEGVHARAWVGRNRAGNTRALERKVDEVSDRSWKFSLARDSTTEWWRWLREAQAPGFLRYQRRKVPRCGPFC